MSARARGPSSSDVASTTTGRSTGSARARRGALLSRRGRALAAADARLPSAPTRAAFAHDAQTQTPLNQTVEDLLLWRDLPKSAACLAAATALYLLLEWSGIPLMTSLSNAGLAAALAAAVWGVAAGAAKL